MEDVNWNVSWFPNVPKYSPSYWDTTLNQRKFIREIAEVYGIHQNEDWQRVSLSLIKKNGGSVSKLRFSIINKGSPSQVSRLISTTSANYFNVSFTNRKWRCFSFAGASKECCNSIAFSAK